MHQEQDLIFFRNFSIVLICLAILMLLFIFLGLSFGGSAEPMEKAITVVKNTAPVGKVQMEGDTPVTPPPTDTGSSVTEVAMDDIGKSSYDGLCVACHGSGIPNIPQLGDVAAWVARIEQGQAILYDHAINGYTGSSGLPMPARGGNAELSDEAVQAAVDYMVKNSQ